MFFWLLQFIVLCVLLTFFVTYVTQVLHHSTLLNCTQNNTCSRVNIATLFTRISIASVAFCILSKRNNRSPAINRTPNNFVSLLSSQSIDFLPESLIWRVAIGKRNPQRGMEQATNQHSVPSKSFLIYSDEMHSFWMAPSCSCSKTIRVCPSSSGWRPEKRTINAGFQWVC